MEPRDDSLGRIPCNPELSSALHRVLTNKTKAKIIRTLPFATLNLKGTCDKGDTVYHLILKNDKLTEEDIMEISEIFRAQGVTPNTRNRERKAKAAVHYAIERRMRNVTDFFIRCRHSRSVPSNALTKFFVEDENEKFWSRARSNCDEELPWDSEQTENESSSFLEWLISREPGFDRKNNEGIGSIEAAIEYNLQHLLTVLLNHIADSATPPSIYLYKFLKKNREERESHDSKINELWYSSYKSRYAAKIVTMLINKGAVVKDLWTKNAQLAIEGKEDIDIVKMLIDHFPSDCVQSQVATTLLHQLIEYSVIDRTDSQIDCYRQILNDLVAKGVDVDEKNDEQMTPVQVAVARKNIHAVLWLNEVGANFAVSTTNSENLLHLLVAEPWICAPTADKNENARAAIFDLLVGKGCDVNAKDTKGATPLHLAAGCNNKSMARKLIERGAEVNCRDGELRTPLHCAGVEPRAFEMIELLLKNGANVNAKNGKGESFLFQVVAAIEYSSSLKMLKLLVKWEPQVNVLHGYDELTLMGLARRIDADSFREFLKCGLEVNNSRFYDFLYERRPRIRTLMDQHCIKLKTAELHCSEDYSSRSRDKQGCQKYYETCSKEIERLKLTFIDGRTSLYDFLRLNLGCKCTHVNDKKLKHLVNAPKLRRRFPRYSMLILAGYHEAAARISLMEPAKAAWLELTEIGLPDICIERVLSYLSNLDLEGMIVP